MNPILFHIGSHPIYWYGVMVALGFIAAIASWNYFAYRDGYPVGTGSDLGFWIMLCSIVGARVAYIMANLDFYLSDPVQIIRLDKGGLIFYGGLIGGTIAVVGFAHWKKTSIWRIGDIAAAGLPIGHALGRIGCFLNGCCYGVPTDSFLGIHMHDAIRHPTQLYETSVNFIIYALLFWYFPRRKKDGAVVALYLMTYPVTRLLIELLRGDERQLTLGLHTAQSLSIAFILIGFFLWIKLPQRRAKDG